MDCGPTCLRMIAKYYGKSYSLQNLREKAQINREGVSLLGISEAAEKLGFRSRGIKVSYQKLQKDAPLPCIVHWDQNHFAVVYKISATKVTVADPAKGLMVYKPNEFRRHWLSTESQIESQGIALLLEPTPGFYKEEEDLVDQLGFIQLFSYLWNYRFLLIQLGLGLLGGSLLQLIFPFLTQSIVDIGVHQQNIHFIYLVLIAQLMLFGARVFTEFIRSWILLHISTRINISILSDFLIKLMKLPIAYFDSKNYGDINQRLYDHRRIESFLTGTSLGTLFSLVNLGIFGFVLILYSLNIFMIFLIGSILYAIWVTIFLR